MHNISIIKYDPKLIGTTPVKSATLKPQFAHNIFIMICVILLESCCVNVLFRAQAAGVELTLVGMSGSKRVGATVVSSTVKTGSELPSNGLHPEYLGQSYFSWVSS